MFIDNLSICPQIACLLSVMFAVEYFITQKRKTGYLRLSYVFLKEVVKHEILPSSKAANCQFSSPYVYPINSAFTCQFILKIVQQNTCLNFFTSSLIQSSRYFVQYNCLERIKVNAIYNDKDINATLLHFPPNSAPHLTI